MEIILEEGFKKVDTHNIPSVSAEMVFSHIANLVKTGAKNIMKRNSDENLEIDFVQMKKDKFCMIKAIVYNSMKSIEEDGKRVCVTLCEKSSTIKSAQCEGCTRGENLHCKHIIDFLFWLYKNSTENEKNEYKLFWNIKSNDNQIVIDDDTVFFKNVVPQIIDENLIKTDDDDGGMITPEEGDNFLQFVLDEMEKIGLTESALYRHCRPINDEFEPIYIHHTMLDTGNNFVRDFKSFIMHMEDVATRGLFLKIAEVSAANYKKKLWIETQFCRIRCSLMHAVLTRQDSSEDDAILKSIFCYKREEKIKEKKISKEHKRFILKQTEKLENKEYKECGLLLNETYPYICASPDGITDDHIVEIKVPKTDEEFEKYLVGKETIAPKYMAQMQIQMYLANVQKALYCVLSPKFETNGAMHYVWVQAELQQVANLLSAAEDYWKEIVFQKIKKIYLEN